jgi:hypothetical protein
MTRTVTVAFLLFVSLTLQLQAAPILVTSRATLGGTDFINWGSLGPAGTLVTDPFNATSNGGITVGIDKTLAGQMQVKQQGAGANNFLGNFAPGDFLIATNNFSTSNNPLLFNFGGAGASAAGTQIQSGSFGSFTARIEAFDVNLVSLGSFTVNGSSSNAGDNSAIFIGLTSDVPIFRVALSLSAAPSNFIGDYAINRFDFTSATTRSGPAAPVDAPEPGTMVVWMLGGMVMFAARFRASFGRDVP